MSDEELLGVIGHEIGHVAKHHSKKAFKQELLTGAAKDAIASAGGVAAALSESQLGALGESLAGAKYSQKQEKEADDYGYEFLKANGKNPWGMVQAFEKFQNMEQGAESSYISKMFSSHPETADRIKRMSQRAEKTEFPVRNNSINTFILRNRESRFRIFFYGTVKNKTGAKDCVWHIPRGLGRGRLYRCGGDA